ncbi:energy transducer TonB [Mariniflexile litorale]|uniref:Energy transducer TonB n=1 Tax=Mariniflexile litorale TaxID=3045158 RepID=A0AAU7EB77_9FLAO|nr:energy transducer TonB [Mariniflexile sp. KMM 9835]MDQ8210468.1 energy transducer TonB [Mariniflexile sp. KMM 9835]
MKYFRTIHEKNSAKLTALISVIILLLLFVVGAPYVDPPEEYGIAVNFGTTDFGSGTVQPLKPIKSEPVNINKPVEVQPTKAEPTKAAEAKEEVLTADNAEEIAIKKQKEVEAKAKAAADAKAKAEADRIAKEKRELEEKKKKLDALIGGVSKSEGAATGGEGDDNKAGDKGQLDGDPYAPSYFGSGGAGSGGVGYGLNGRGKPQFKKPEGCDNEYGLVVVSVVVNKNGNVIEAIPGAKGTTNITDCLRQVAKIFAMSIKWPADLNAPDRQKGFVQINFTSN